MGNPNLVGGLLSGLAQGIHVGQQADYQRQLLKLKRDDLNAEIKRDEAKQALAEAQRTQGQSMLSQMLAYMQGNGGPSLTTGQTEPLGAGVMPTPSPPATAAPAAAFNWQAQPQLKKYQDLIEQTAAKYNLPPGRLASFIDIESGGNPNAVSPAGAKGLMQLMPGTAQEMGLAPEQIFDPAANLDAGAKYYRQQLDRFKGNEPMAIAAYYRGPGFVEAQKGVPADQDTMAYLQKHAGHMPFQKTAAAQAPSTMSTNAPGQPPRAPMTFAPTVNFNKDGSVSFGFAGQQQKYEIEHREIRLPNGNTQIVQIITDPITAQSWSQPFGMPSPPEAVIESQRRAEAMGYPLGTEANKNAATQLRIALDRPPNEKNLAIERLEAGGLKYKAGLSQTQTTPPAGAGAPAGETLSQEVERREREQKAAIEKANIEVRTATEPLPPVEAKLIASLQRQARAEDLLREKFRPEYIGTPLQHYIGAHKGEWERQLKIADDKTKVYQAGAFSGYIDGWIKQLKGTISDDQAAFYKALGDFQDTILRERSGAAISPGEFARISGFTVGVWDSPKEFMAGLDRMRDEINNSIRDLYRTRTEPATAGLERQQQKMTRPTTPAPTRAAPTPAAPAAKPPAKGDDRATQERSARGMALIGGLRNGQLSPEAVKQGLMALGYPRNAVEQMVADELAQMQQARPAPGLGGQTGRRIPAR